MERSLARESALEEILPEIKGNKTDVLFAENEIKQTKSTGDIAANSGGEYSSQEQNNIMTGTGNMSTSTFYAGLSKKLIPTGTSLSTEFNYAKTSYRIRFYRAKYICRY